MVANREQIQADRSTSFPDFGAQAVQNQVITGQVFAQIQSIQALLQAGHAASGFDRLWRSGQETCAEAVVVFEIANDRLSQVLQEKCIGLWSTPFAPERLYRGQVGFEVRGELDCGTWHGHCQR